MMRKLTLIATLLMVAAFVLAACGGTNNNAANQTPGAAGVTTGTPAAGEGTGAGSVATVAGPTPTGEAKATATAAETKAASGAESTATAAATAGSTGAATAATTGTPGANVPVTGNEECKANTVSGLLHMNVVDSQGGKIGKVASLIVLRDTQAVNAKPESNGASAAAQATGTPAATAAATKAATPAAGTNTGATGATVAPKIAYVVIDRDNSDKTIVVPLAALAPAGKTTTPGAGNVIVTKAPGAENGVVITVTPSGKTTPAADDNKANACTLTLKGVKADALDKAPAFESNADFSAAGWDKDYRTFWAGRGISVPVTGENSLGNPVVLTSNFNNIDAKNANGDDLGKVEDFIFNQQTGSVQYGVLAAGGFLGIGEKKVLVPANRMQWIADKPGDKEDVGHIVININQNDWKNAPTFDSKVDTTVQGWDKDIQAYWANLKDSTK